PVVRILEPPFAIDDELILIDSGWRCIKRDPPKSVLVLVQFGLVPAVEVSGQGNSRGLIALKSKQHLAVFDSWRSAIDRLEPKRFVPGQRHSLPRVYHTIPRPLKRGARCLLLISWVRNDDTKIRSKPLPP